MNDRGRVHHWSGYVFGEIGSQELDDFGEAISGSPRRWPRERAPTSQVARETAKETATMVSWLPSECWTAPTPSSRLSRTRGRHASGGWV